MPDPVRFIVIWGFSLIALAVLVVAANYVVDPYEVFGTPRIAGINLVKPGAKNHAMMAKTYEVARAHPKTVLIGSSTTHIGLDAADSTWPEALRPVFNYGIPGGFATAVGLSTLREAIATGGVKEAVVFLDLQAFFTPDHPATGVSEDDRRFRLLADGSPNPYRRLQVGEDGFLALFTLGALMDSAGTVLRQGRPDTLSLATDGSSTEADFVNAAKIDGMYDIFAQKTDFEVGRAEYLRKLMATWQGPLPNLDVIARIIDLAQAHHVKLILVIAPHHADALELYWRNGLWPRVEQFKSEVVALVAEQDHGVVLWDFLDYAPYATEAVPPDGDRHTPTKWFWESTHFKKALGHIMLARINGAPAPDYGVILTPDNLSARNTQVRAQRNVVVCGSGLRFLTTVTNAPSDDCGLGRQASRQAG